MKGRFTGLFVVLLSLIVCIAICVCWFKLTVSLFVGIMPLWLSIVGVLYLLLGGSGVLGTALLITYAVLKYMEEEYTNKTETKIKLEESDE